MKEYKRFYTQKYSNFGTWVVCDREGKFNPQSYPTRKAARFARDAMNNGKLGNAAQNQPAGNADQNRPHE